MYVLHQEYSKEVCPGFPTQSRNLPLPEFLFSQAPHTHSPIVSLSHTLISFSFSEYKEI